VDNSWEEGKVRGYERTEKGGEHVVIRVRLERSRPGLADVPLDRKGS